SDLSRGDRVHLLDGDDGCARVGPRHARVDERRPCAARPPAAAGILAHGCVSESLTSICDLGRTVVGLYLAGVVLGSLAATENQTPASMSFLRRVLLNRKWRLYRHRVGYALGRCT